MDVDVLHGHLLLALAAMPIERFEQDGPGPGQLGGLAQILSPPLEGLLADHSAAVAFHPGIMGSDQLRGHHAFQLVSRTDADKRGEGGTHLPVERLRVRVLEPERLDGLMGEQIVPVI